MPNYQNIHGRKPGRGLRPFLLIPKYLCVATLLGSLIATLVILPLMPENAADPRWLIVRRIYHVAIIPATAGSVFFGILLLLQHPRPFLRMRWLIVKLLALACVVPTAHLRLSQQLRQGYIIWQHVWLTTFLALLAFILIAILGRLKPRLRQKYGSP
jgi:hypothetical protein